MKAITINARLITASMLVLALALTLGGTAWQSNENLSVRINSVQRNGEIGRAHV